MQEHQESQGEVVTPAAQTRVKTEELAHALAAIEARRQDEACRMADTVALGDAVRDLQLDVTPEEILAEVQTQRARQQKRVVTEQTRPSETWPVFGMTAKILCAIIGAFLFLAWAISPVPHPQSVVPISSPLVAVTPPAPVNLIPPVYEPIPTLLQTNQERLTEFYRSGRPLVDLPDNLAFTCDVIAGRDILRDSLPQNNFMPHRPFPGRIGWTFIKRQGQMYVRGWVPKRYTQSIESAALVHVYNSLTAYDLGRQPRPITLRVDGMTFREMYICTEPAGVDGYKKFDVHSPMTGSSQFTASHVHLDSHAWEKWQ